MLQVREGFPDELLGLVAHRLHEVLAGPTLIHVDGRRAEPVFVSVLLHGNEDAGWEAVRRVLMAYRGAALPRALSVFVGNVAAARHRLRRLDNQTDYNRIWPGTPQPNLPEAAMARRVVDLMCERRVFASLDIHNNTGLNPHYACINRLDQAFLHLATLFSRTVVYYTRPLGVQSAAFAELCPSVTLECGKPGTQLGAEHAASLLDACLNLAEFPAHSVPVHDIELYHTVATVKVPAAVGFGFGPGDWDIAFPADLDHMNFRELEPGTVFARVLDGNGARLEVTDEDGAVVTDRLIDAREGQLRLRKRLMPAMLTRDERVIRQDCLCYLMERLPYPLESRA
jgi:succinylglutamate desuccinylase